MWMNNDAHKNNAKDVKREENVLVRLNWSEHRNNKKHTMKLTKYTFREKNDEKYRNEYELVDANNNAGQNISSTFHHWECVRWDA